MAHPYRESSPQRYRLGARSCRGCYERKVRCDRGVPCTNCSRCGIACMYPTKDRDRARKTHSLQNISDRLERLEALLSQFSESSQGTTRPAAAREGLESQPQIRVQQSSDHRSRKSTWQLLLNDEQVVNSPDVEMPQRTHATHNPHAQPDTDAPPDMVSDVLAFYPDTKLALQLWNVYVKSVDPVLKILHIPSAQSTVIATVLDPRSAPSPAVSLTYAIYFAAVTSLCHDNSNKDPVDLPCEKATLLKRYKTTLDRLLLVADLMNQPELTALQALAIYVTCLRVHEGGRSAWVLNGLAIRLAQSIGLHRDGVSLQLSPFETEMRLRLWWHLCVLDSRAPEDQGLQPTVDVINRDLRLPLNVNDDQICPDMTCLPVESDGWTEMSFFLIQTDSCRLLYPILDVQEQHSPDALLDITEKREMVRGRGRYLSEKYGMLSGSGKPPDLSHIAGQHTTTAYKKMKFILQLRKEISMRQQSGGRHDTTPAVLQPSFKLACETLESNYVLLKAGLAASFTWFFSMYTQWYALAYVLRCLCGSSRLYGSETERAWTLVDELFPRGLRVDGDSERGQDLGPASIARCLSLLRSQALALRQHAQLSVASAHVDIHSCSCDNSPSRLLRDTAIPSSQHTTASPRETPSLPELARDFIAEAPQGTASILPSLDLSMSMPLSMSDIAFLPDQDWNMVVNGWLNEDGHLSVL